MFSLGAKLLKWKCGNYSNTEQPLHVAKEINTTLCHQKLLPTIKKQCIEINNLSTSCEKYVHKYSYACLSELTNRPDI